MVGKIFIIRIERQKQKKNWQKKTMFRAHLNIVQMETSCLRNLLLDWKVFLAFEIKETKKNELEQIFKY